MARKMRKRVHRRKRKTHRRMRGSGFFGSLWDGIKSAVRKPSTWLAGASMLPTPLAPIFKVGSVVSGLTGNGRRKRLHRKRRGGMRMPLYMRGSGMSITEPLA